MSRNVKDYLRLNYFEIVHSPLACEQACDWVSGRASPVWSRASRATENGLGRKGSADSQSHLACLARRILCSASPGACSQADSACVFFFCITSGCKKVYQRVGFHELEYRKG